MANNEVLPAASAWQAARCCNTICIERVMANIEIWQATRSRHNQTQALKVWQAHRYGKQRVMVGKTVWELPRCGRKCGMAYGKARQAAGYDGQSVNVGAVAWRAAASSGYGKQYGMASRNVWRNVAQALW